MYPLEVSGHALSGSSALAEEMMLDELHGTPGSNGGGRGVVRFVKGEHSTLLSPVPLNACPGLSCEPSETELRSYGECVRPYQAVIQGVHQLVASFVGAGGKAAQVENTVEVDGELIEIVSTEN